jgi:hypothetical protein
MHASVFHRYLSMSLILTLLSTSSVVFDVVTVYNRHCELAHGNKALMCARG